MERYIIALQYLGVNNANLISLLHAHIYDLPFIFAGKLTVDSVLDLVSYAEYFSDKDRVNAALEYADKILKDNKELGIKTVYFMGDGYPKELAQIDNPPALIYYKGQYFDDMPERSIACVGTRKPTLLSYNAVNYLVPQWVSEHCSIVSGLACGVDKISHQACISAGGKTIAVLAHGLDTIYPKENKVLADRIIDAGGILMSEYPIGTKPERYRFVNRNRLIVGMSRAIVIYECDVKGGTMHNVEYALKQKKKIFCPAIGEITSEVQTGTKKLLDDGIAEVIREGRDISKVIEAVGGKFNNGWISANVIKRNYIRTLLNIVNEYNVIAATLQNLQVDIVERISEDEIVELINEKVENGAFSYDDFIKEMVNNNIRSIENNLIFED